MERRVNDFHLVGLIFDNFGMNDLLFDGTHVDRIKVTADAHVEASFFRILFGHRLHRIVIGDGAYGCHDTRIMRRRDLCAVCPVGFVAVVFRRVVAGGDHDACHASVGAQCKRQHRRRTKRIADIGADAVRCQTQCRFVGKLRRELAAVVGDGHARHIRFGTQAILVCRIRNAALCRDVIRECFLVTPDGGGLCLDVIGQSLCRLAHGVDVHAVVACTDDAA